MIKIDAMLPEVGQLVTIKYQYGEDPTVRTTELIWWDDILHNYHVIEWEAV